MGQQVRAVDLIARLQGFYGTLPVKVGRSECRELLTTWHERHRLSVADIAGRAVAA